MREHGVVRGSARGELPGDRFVDASGIDCVCRQLAPAVFARSAASDPSYVACQPPSASLATAR
jgi:hypothetical protein